MSYLLHVSVWTQCLSDYMYVLASYNHKYKQVYGLGEALYPGVEDQSSYMLI